MKYFLFILCFLWGVSTDAPHLFATTLHQDKEMMTQQILDFWFSHPTKWFDKDANFDALIKQQFLKEVEAALSGKHDDWQDNPESILALVILLDQFTRNIFRSTKDAFCGDEKAVFFCKKAIEKGYDQKLSLIQRKFLYMPLMHSEDLATQELSLKMFLSLDDEQTHHYAILHYDIIKKFGRFPHRNEWLGRISTFEEKEFLKQPGSQF